MAQTETHTDLAAWIDHWIATGGTVDTCSNEAYVTLYTALARRHEDDDAPRDTEDERNMMLDKIIPHMPLGLANQLVRDALGEHLAARH